MKTKYLTIYKDFVVRESTTSNPNQKHEIAVLKYNEYKKYNPSLFPSKRRFLAEIYLWETEEFDLPISNHISIVKITEKEDSDTNRDYYKELHFHLRDSNGNEAIICKLDNNNFLLCPEYDYCYESIQRGLSLIRLKFGYLNAIPDEYRLKVIVDLQNFKDFGDSTTNYDEEYLERRTFNQFRGTYAQDVAGFSDEEINIVFEGDPDLYWNID